MMTTNGVGNFLLELNAAGVERLVIGKDGTKVTCEVGFANGQNVVLPHFHIRCLPSNLRDLVVTWVNQAATVLQPLVTDGS
jgi:hypothetical protein